MKKAIKIINLMLSVILVILLVNDICKSFADNKNA